MKKLYKCKLRTQKKQQSSQEQTNTNPYEYYYDHYSRDDKSKFILEKRIWERIKQYNSSDKYLTDKELEYIALINGFLKTSVHGVEYFSLEYLCRDLNITPRHLRRVRTNTSHIFKTKWKKAVYTYKGRLQNVYSITSTEHTGFLLGETSCYE